eukprot:3793301-Rhodomonas_salina.1
MVTEYISIPRFHYYCRLWKRNCRRKNEIHARYLVNPATCLRTPYTMSGTDSARCETRYRDSVWRYLRLRAGYAMSGTDIAYHDGAICLLTCSTRTRTVTCECHLPRICYAMSGIDTGYADTRSMSCFWLWLAYQTR